jgi:hypothetical protein
MLTVELNSQQQSIEIFCDAEGLETLEQQLRFLRTGAGHVHLMTESWAGTELTEQPQGDANQLFHHLRITLFPPG